MPDVDYLKDPQAIYAQSFATVRAEADLARFDAEMEEIVVRLIHACGVPAISANIDYSRKAVSKGRDALGAGATIFVDAEMVGAGIIRRHLAGNDVTCTLNDDAVPIRAREQKTTRSAAAVDLWATDLAGAICVFGNAPTALFRLLELVEAGAPMPALVLGFPVGFVGAAESKVALASNRHGLEFITLHGRMGGSAMASAAVNALAAGLR